MPRHASRRPDPGRAPTVAALDLLARLPARLADLPPGARRAVGSALDRRAARLALGQDGAVLVLRGIGR